LEELIYLCEREQDYFDINYKKFYCLNIVSRCDVWSANVTILKPINVRVSKMGHYKKFDVKNAIQYSNENVSFKSPEVLRNTTNHVLP